MIVKDLITQLQGVNPDADVIIVTEDTAFSKVIGVSKEFKNLISITAIKE